MIAQVVGEGFTWWSWENVLTICCLLSLWIFRPPLSPDSHCSAKCSRIQGSFHVPVTLLGVPVQYRPAASSLTLKCGSSHCAAAAGPFAYVSVHLEWFFFFMSVRAWMYKVRYGRAERCVYILIHACTCVVYRQICVINVGSGAASGMPAAWNVFVSLCVNIYKSWQWASCQRHGSQPSPFAADCASALPLSWAEMAHCKEPKKQPSGLSIVTIAKRGGRKWNCCCYSGHKSLSQLGLVTSMADL